MISVSELLVAAKSAHAIQSNYRLARVLDTTDNTLYRWTSGKGVPDDTHAVKLADMAGLDRGYVIAAMRALRETNDELRAEWEDMARRLLAQSGGLHAPAGSIPGGDGGPIGGKGHIEREGDDPGGIGAAARGEGSVRYVNSSRQGRIIMASLVKALRKKSSH